jgi:predicted adenine nucleotide alpha hydrolase (AANH) superfamily ATPase
MKLLMHICCAPCLAYPYEVIAQMMEKGEIETFAGYFHNPNIHPQEESERRKDAVKVFAAAKNIDVAYSDAFEMQKWLDFRGPKDARCEMCYAGRLEETAKRAKELGFDAFSTSLLVSPYQKHEMIRSIGESVALKHGVDFFYRDFREGYRRGQNIAREMDLYRQKYCGCAYRD